MSRYVLRALHLLARFVWCVLAVRFIVEGSWAFGGLMIAMLILLEWRGADF